MSVKNRTSKARRDCSGADKNYSHWSEFSYFAKHAINLFKDGRSAVNRQIVKRKLISKSINDRTCGAIR